jgi:hypothetical protein
MALEELKTKTRRSPKQTVIGAAYGLLEQTWKSVGTARAGLAQAKAALDADAKSVLKNKTKDRHSERIKSIYTNIQQADEALSTLQAICHRIGEEYSAATEFVPRGWVDDAVSVLSDTEAAILQTLQAGIVAIMQGEKKWGDPKALDDSDGGEEET